MTIQQFIEKAIEGGWKAANKPYLDRSETGWATVGFHEVSVNVLMWHHEILLDPEAWKAVGKMEGWDSQWEVSTGLLNEYGDVPMSEGKIIDRWEYEMHRMIDALADGKSVEQYLETL